MKPYKTVLIWLEVMVTKNIPSPKRFFCFWGVLPVLKIMGSEVTVSTTESWDPINFTIDIQSFLERSMLRFGRVPCYPSWHCI